jgi:hypothetical protein
MSFVCISLDCRENKTEAFESTEKHPTCPHCGYANAIRKVAVIHFLTRDKNGPIKGDGANYRIACGKRPAECAHATGEPQAANCPECLATLTEETGTDKENTINRESASQPTT